MDFHLCYCMALREIEKHGTLSLSNGVINGHVFALISSVMDKTDSPEDINRYEIQSVVKDIKTF